MTFFQIRSTYVQGATQSYSVADPGFPRGGGANSLGGAPTYEFVEFSQKLHEIERIWTPRGRGRASPVPPLDPPLLFCVYLFSISMAMNTQCEKNKCYCGDFSLRGQIKDSPKEGRQHMILRWGHPPPL